MRFHAAFGYNEIITVSYGYCPWNLPDICQIQVQHQSDQRITRALMQAWLEKMDTTTGALHQDNLIRYCADESKSKKLLTDFYQAKNWEKHIITIPELKSFLLDNNFFPDRKLVLICRQQYELHWGFYYSDNKETLYMYNPCFGLSIRIDTSDTYLDGSIEHAADFTTQMIRKLPELSEITTATDRVIILIEPEDSPDETPS